MEGLLAVNSQSWLSLTWQTVVFLVFKMKLRAKFCTANYLCLCSAVSPEHEQPPYAGSHARHPGWGPPNALIQPRCTPYLFRDDNCLSWGLWSLCSCPKAGHTGKCSPPAITGIISPSTQKTEQWPCSPPTATVAHPREGQRFVLGHTCLITETHNKHRLADSKHLILYIHLHFISLSFSLLEYQKGKQK